MKSGLRGGKPRDIATMSHGGKTSRGAGAAQRGFNYNIYAEGGKVDSRKGRVRAFDLEGREIPWPPSKEDYSKPPAGKIEYDEGGKRIRGYDKDTDAEIEWPPSRRNMDKPPVNLRKDTGKPISASPNREYAKGGKVKKYAEGNKVTEYGRSRGTESMPEWDVPQYSLSDLFGRKKAPESKSDYSAGAVKKEPLPAPKSSSEENTGAGDRIRQEALDRDEASRASRPRATESLPTRPTSQQRRMTRRAAGTEFLSTDPAVTGPSRSRIPRPMTEEERAAIAGFVRPVDLRVPRRPRLVPFKSIDDMRLENHRGGARRLDSKGYWETSRGVPFFRKGGSVKMAGGGTCRGMGAATKGGKYTIK